MAALTGALIVFDLDGTLVDTAPDLVRALNQTLALLDLPPASEAQARAFIGAGARALIAETMAAAGIPPLDEAKTAELIEAFVSFYAADIAGRSRPFPGAIEAMDALAAEGACFAICTNKRQDLSEQLLRALGLAHRFDAIVGADRVPARKPDPGHYRAAVAQAGCQTNRSVMVGDSLVDLQAARGAGAPMILARFGYGAAEAEPHGPDAVIDHFSALPEAVMRRLGAS